MNYMGGDYIEKTRKPEPSPKIPGSDDPDQLDLFDQEEK